MTKSSKNSRQRSLRKKVRSKSKKNRRTRRNVRRGGCFLTSFFDEKKKVTPRKIPRSPPRQDDYVKVKDMEINKKYYINPQAIKPMKLTDKIDKENKSILTFTNDAGVSITKQSSNINRYRAAPGETLIEEEKEEE